MQKLKAIWTDESNMTDLADMSEDKKNYLKRILSVFLDFVEILLRRKIKETITGEHK